MTDSKIWHVNSEPGIACHECWHFSVCMVRIDLYIQKFQGKRKEKSKLPAMNDVCVCVFIHFLKKKKKSVLNRLRISNYLLLGLFFPNSVTQTSHLCMLKLCTFSCMYTKAKAGHCLFENETLNKTTGRFTWLGQCTFQVTIQIKLHLR